MTQVHGFELVRDLDLPEINSKGKLYRHIKTGAEVVSLENDDENKCFSITFRTPPEKSDGLPHIMEHSVLCGSRKYPLKEPFIELVKGSLATFINAFTFPDKTIYPLASQNTQDFYNLIDVYLDSVFYPLITPEILKQEGWHYELENADDPLIYKGVVFNEMKGAYSSPDSVLGRYTQQAVFPDTPYGVDSGGDPEVIPELTYEEFRDFHDRYYHPSNARVFFYGDDDPQERLRILDNYLKDFDKLEVDSSIALQESFEAPRRMVISYDAGEEAQKKGMVTVSWLLPDTHNTELSLSLGILEHILVGTPASPLRKALIDSGLGEDITGGGLNDQLQQMMFATGLKGIAVEDAEKVEKLILSTLRKLVEDGIDADMIEASMNTVEFQLREFNTGGFPRGLAMMITSFSTWLYDGDPFAPLKFDAPLESIKQRIASGEKYFESLVDAHLVKNMHRSTVLLKPDSGVTEQKEERETDRLGQVRDSLNQDAIQAIIDDTQALRHAQEAPDLEENLAKLPTLSVGDLDKQNKIIPLEVSEDQGSKVLYHDLFTNGIFYLDVGFDLHTLPQEYLPYINLFGKALLEMGTRSEDFVKLSQRIGRKTGGIRPDVMTLQVRESTESALWLFLRGKSTVSQTDDMLDILRDVLLTANFDDRGRFLQIVLKEKAMKEAQLVPAGHQIVALRLNSHFNTAGWLSEQTGGIDYLFFLRGLIQKIENDWASVLASLEGIRNHLIMGSNAIVNATIDAANWTTLSAKVSGFIGSLPSGNAQKMQWQPNYRSGNEGLTIPAQVNYVGKGANLFDLGYKNHGSSGVITKFLGTTWLWDRIRVQGGAYGGFCNFNPYSGIFNFLSYRDPNLLGTLENYDKTSEFLLNLDLNEKELSKSIIGAIGGMDTYMLPDAKGYTSMQFYLTRYTNEKRQQVRDEVLSTTLRNFQEFGEILARLNEVGQVVVMGSQEDIQAANEQNNNFLPITKVL